jgi:hypothetical protein
LLRLPWLGGGHAESFKKVQRRRRSPKPKLHIGWLLIFRERQEGLRLTRYTGIGKLILAKTEQQVTLRYHARLRHFFYFL